MKVLRCAVYTRKSTEDGLEQEFNSLHAQREACEAFVLSQRHEGWVLLPQAYDDGGFSGGNMQRPGLAALLAEVDAGHIDVIVVYKVDRLTRSLADFAKIVERLDAQEASFVSVTQAFNTTSSMGRLTLNVLLSFAQFEREVTGERIRDKIAASKKKGLWMGGPVPLGYEVKERKLVIMPQEAERVRMIMRRYLEVGTVPALLEVLQKEGVRTKVQVRTSGPHRGGIVFRRGSLFHLLRNPVYCGKIIHKGSVYDGEHEPIIDEALWQAVQEQLARKAPPRKTTNNEGQNALLQGLLWDAHARPMVPTYNSKGPRRYSYYETRKDLARPTDPSASRYQRAMLETHILQHLAELLEDDHALCRFTLVDQAGQLASAFAAASGLAADLQDRSRAPRAIQSLVERIVVSSNDIRVRLKAEALGLDPGDEPTATLPLPTRKPFREVKLRIDAVAHAPNEALIKLLADAHQVQRLVLASPELSLNALGKREGRCRTQLGRLLRLSWISPRIVEAVVAGTQPKGLTRAALLRETLPLSWAEQERLLGLSG